MCLPNRIECKKKSFPNLPATEILLASLQPESALLRRDTHRQGPHRWDSRLPEQCTAAPLFHKPGLGSPCGCSSPSRGHRSTGHIPSWPTACRAAAQNTTKGRENTSMNPAANQTCEYISFLSLPVIVFSFTLLPAQSSFVHHNPYFWLHYQGKK